jgi:predicted dehydrogenase
MSKTLKFLVVGYGSIGRRHVRNLESLKVGIILFRTKKEKNVEKRYKVYYDFDEALGENPDAVLITNPTALHIPTALVVAKSGHHLFIEKPISHDLKGVDKLIQIATKKNLIVLIGHNLRFHPSIRLMKELITKKYIGNVISIRAQAGQYLPDWRPKQDYRKSYSADKSLGGGVILDLVHELDYARWFLGDAKEVFSFYDKLSRLKISTEDVAEILIRFKNNAIGEVHLDYIQRPGSRSCQIIGEKGTIFWDSNKKQVELFSSKLRRWLIFPEDKNFNINQTYIEEMKHFLRCIQHKDKPLVTVADGKKVLEIALAAKKSAKVGKVVHL